MAPLGGLGGPGGAELVARLSGPLQRIRVLSRSGSGAGGLGFVGGSSSTTGGGVPDYHTSADPGQHRANKAFAVTTDGSPNGCCVPQLIERIQFPPRSLGYGCEERYGRLKLVVAPTVIGTSMLQTNNVQADVDREPMAMIETQSGTEILQSFLGFVRRQFSVILFVTLLALALGVIYVITARPSYTAQAQLLIDARKVQVFQQQSVLGDISDRCGAGRKPGRNLEV